VIAFRQGDQEQARRVFRNSLEQRPTDLRLLMELANFEAQTGNPDEAGRLLRQAMEAHPAELQPRLVMARRHVSEGEPRRAISLLEPVREHHARDPAFLEILGRAQVAAGQLEGGINTLRQLAEVASDVPEVHYLLGSVYRQADRLSDARRALGRAVSLDTSHVPALLALGTLEREAGRYAEAGNWASRLQALEAGRAEGYLLEGDIQYAQGDHARAARAYASAYEARPAGPVAIKHFDAMRRAGQADTGATALQRHVEAYPDDYQARLMLATYYVEVADHARGAGHYEVLVEVLPENALVLNNLAYAYQRLDDPRALEMAREAHRLRPDEPRIQDTYGVAQLEFGDTAQGLSLIESARSALPDDPAIGYHLGLALARNDRPAEAVRVLKALLAQEQDFTDRERAKRLLAELE
jgi:putative PEP-CTERM system TPR-repeat lipoprotein